MAAVLARLSVGRVRAWSVAAAVVCLGAAPPSAQAYREPMPLSDTEVRSFVSELTFAFRGCDVDWLAQAYLPSSTLTVDVDGQSSIAVGIEETLEAFRRDCEARPLQHIFRSYGPADLAVRVEGYRAIVRRKPSGGLLRPLFPATQLPEYGVAEETLFLIRYNGAILVEAVRSLAPSLPEGFLEQREVWHAQGSGAGQ